MSGALSKLKVLDLSRVFAGPATAQMLADFGADVIKVERPGRGDDVRQQGFRLKDKDGNETTETSSFLAMNRGKRSVTIDMSKPAGQQLIKRLAAQCDVLIENFKAGDLRRYGLDYDSLHAINPRLVYCSITGFGQTGPYSHLPGYDPIFQSMSGLMSITGNADGEPGAWPQKVGYSISDITASQYAVIAIMVALYHRDAVSGAGQHLDIALFDTQLAAISHMAMNYLVTGDVPTRLGTGSVMTCPWQSFECSDGHIMIAVGNDPQFAAFCEQLGRPELATDERFRTNPLRVRNRAVLIPMIAERMLQRPVEDWLAALGRGNVPCGPINNFEQVFKDPQIRHREMRREMRYPLSGSLPFVANPIRFSATPNDYSRPPPLLGQHTDEVLAEFGLGTDEVEQLRRERIV